MTYCAPTTLDEAIQGAILDLLTDRLAVERLTRTPDSSGGTTEGYAVVTGLDDVPCRIVPSGGGELIVADRLGLVDTYTVTVPYGTDVRPPDELVALGLRFRVQHVPQADTRAVSTVILATVVA